MHKIEVFTAGCPLCLDTMKMIKEATKECGCEVIEYRCSGTECCEEAKSYGIKAVPSIAIDGKLVIEGKPTLDQLKNYIQ